MLHTRMRASRLAVLTAAVLAVAAVAASSAQATNLSLSLVTRANGHFGAPANAYSAAMATSRNGRFVAFYSMADNLGAPGGLQGYLRDTLTGSTKLFGRATGVNGELADAEIYPGGVSDDGRFVSFTSYAWNLHPDAQHGSDPGMWPEGNIYVRDMFLNKTILVSRANGADGEGADGMSHGDSISADGRYVAFNSASTNLSPDASSIGPYGWPTQQTYVRDLATNTIKLASRENGASGAPADLDSTDHTSISSNGQFVLFKTDATNLSDIDVDSGVTDAFVRDMNNNTTTLASRENGDGPGFSAWTIYAQLSGDGRHAVITNGGGVWVRDLATNVTEHVSRSSASDGNDPADDTTYGWSSSYNGRFVAFSSEANNLSDDADPDQRNVYVRDRLTDKTVLVSRRPGFSGDGGDGYSDNGYVSNDGFSVVFNTFASNLLNDDINDDYAMKAAKALVLYP